MAKPKGARDGPKKGGPKTDRKGGAGGARGGRVEKKGGAGGGGKNRKGREGKEREPKPKHKDMNPKEKRQEKRKIREQRDEEYEKTPKSFVLARGDVGKMITQLSLDMRNVMRPYTATKLVVRFLSRLVISLIDRSH